MKKTREKKRILVTDDEPDMCWALERILKGMGFMTAAATSGREALQLAERTPFHLAFLDAKLPDMEGIELARRLRRLEPAIPVVLVSAYFYEDDAQVQQWVRQGLIRHFISKPFLVDQVQTATLAAE